MFMRKSQKQDKTKRTAFYCNISTKTRANIENIGFFLINNSCFNILILSVISGQ